MMNNRWIKWALVVLMIGIGGGIFYYYYRPSTEVFLSDNAVISDYNEARDKKDVVDLFHKDWYWLSNRDYEEPRLEYMLETRSPNEYAPEFYGKMNIKVLREDGKLVGFVTYYPKNFYEGIILFLAVNPEFRGKRYGQKLSEYAIGELKKMGASIVTLVTRENNQSARTLYKRTGFTESVEPDDGFYKYVIKTH